MPSTVAEEREIGRLYTRSRRFPKFIGRFHDGTKIPGGPYTLTQGAVLAIVLMGALLTQRVWGTPSPLVNIPTAALIAWGSAWAVGRIPASRRNPLSIVAGAVLAATRPATGRYRDTTVRLAAPHQVTGRIHIRAQAGPDTAPVAAAAAVAQQPAGPLPAPMTAAVAVTTAPVPRPRHAVSGVERLLMQARTTK